MQDTISDSPLVGVIVSRIPDVPSGVTPGRMQLADVVTSIALHFRPERIVLFGSRAAGTSTEASDVDLMVVMETTLRPPDAKAGSSRLATSNAAVRHVDWPQPINSATSINPGLSTLGSRRFFINSSRSTRSFTWFEAPLPGSVRLPVD